MDIRRPPQNLETEQAFLGALLLNSEKIHDVLEIVLPESFYAPKHKVIFKAMQSLVTKGEPIDVVTVGNRLEGEGDLEPIGGNSYLAELVDAAPTSSNIDTYARLISAQSTRRNLIQVSGAISDYGHDEKVELDDVLDLSEKALFDVTQRQSHKYLKMETALPSLVEEIINISNDGKSRGIPSGFPTLDNKTSGFQNSDLIILAARPGMGKTTFALDIARKTALKHNTPVGIFSLEMSADQLLQRCLAAEAKIHAWKMRTGGMRDKDSLQRLNDAAGRLSSAPIFIDDKPGNNILNIRSTARRMKRDHGIKLLLVDYLQLITPHETRRSDSLVYQITEISRTLKFIARELQIPVIALSQLSRDIEKRSGKPRLSDLRDSGSIEQDADVVMFLHKENATYEGASDAGVPEQISLLIEKHRNGPTGRVSFLFDKKFVSFQEPDTKHAFVEEEIGEWKLPES